MSELSPLVRAAVVGVRVRPFTPESLPAPLARALPAPAQDDADPEGAGPLLDAAAAWGVARRGSIGTVTATALDLPSGSRPLAPEALSGLARKVQAHTVGEEQLLDQVLDLVAEGGWRLPAGLLLDLQPLYRQQPERLEHVLATMDERTIALLGSHPRWKHLIALARPEDPLDPAAWTRGSLSRRMAYFTRLRRQDPAAALALLEPTAWRKEEAETRSQLLHALRTGLGPADEPFLEAALTDRSSAVSTTAAQLLILLPGSALVARAEALAVAHLHVTLSPEGRPLIACDPVESTPQVGRDQYSADPRPPRGLAQRLQEVVARVPLHRWPELIGLTAEQMADARVRCKGQTVDLRYALVEAAWRAGDADFVERRTTEAFRRRSTTALSRFHDYWPQRYTSDLSLQVARAVAADYEKTGTPMSITTLAMDLPERCAPGSVGEVLGVLQGAQPEPAAPRSYMGRLCTRLCYRQELEDLRSCLLTGASPRS